MLPAVGEYGIVFCRGKGTASLKGKDEEEWYSQTMSIFTCR